MCAICIVNDEEDWNAIRRELDKQYHKNLHYIVVSDIVIFNKIKLNTISKISNIDFVDKHNLNYGQILYNVMPFLKNKYFLFIDGDTVLHKNHILKLVNSIESRDNLFVYSGTYIQYKNNERVLGYKILNSDVIEKNNFLCFLRPDLNSIDTLLQIERMQPLSSVIYSKEILKYVQKDELDLISTSIVQYLNICSILKANKFGHYLNNISCGYNLIPNEKISKQKESNLKYYLQYKRVQNLSIKDLFLAFYKYDVNPDDCRCIYQEQRVDKKLNKAILYLKKHKNFYRILKTFIPKLPNCNEIILLEDFFKQNKKLKNIVYIISEVIS